MDYCTQQDMMDRFDEEELIQLTDEHNTGDINTDKLNKVITDASAEMDAYLTKYLPLPAVHPTLTRIACHITRYYLYDDAATDRVTKLYDDGIKFLKAVSKGEISLGPNTDGSEPQNDNVAEIQTGGRVFGREDKSFI